jgi:hypothetical protein
MRKNFKVGDKLFKEANAVCGATPDAETLRLDIETVPHAAYERLRGLLGSEPHAKDVPRRRERASRKRGLGRNDAIGGASLKTG